jgi:DNA primase
VSCQKYLGFTGVGTRLFNVRAIHTAHDHIEVTEGELDAITLGQLGYHAVAVTGATNWKAHYARVLAGFDLVRVWGDGDTAGREFARIVTGAVGGQARAVKMPDGLDVNELYLQEGEAGVRTVAESYQARS